jgi:two-component system CheB/CheR fusion protein
VDGRADRMPIDYFFRSLAEHENERAIGIVLSGNGSDGTLGMQAIAASGGVTFAQSKKDAKFASMPSSAVATGCVDFVLRPDRMALELKIIARRLLQSPYSMKEFEDKPVHHEKAFEEILVFLRHHMSVDFTHYKHATLRRRIDRRMMLHKLKSLDEYRDYLRKHSEEIKELFNDILIHVTGFFRDPQIFQVLRKKILPHLIRGRSKEDTLRIWIPGCSTGEEVYSLAMVLAEVMTHRKLRRPTQIFGTDINETALEKARAGIYPESIQSELSPERLQRFFTRSDGGFRVNKTIREMCIFARQNLTVDPPFSNLDLISCRNVLIYLGPVLQRKIMPVFHYALRQNGLLMLGASETVGTFADLFSLTDKKARVYTKKAAQLRPAVTFINSLPAAVVPGNGETPNGPPVQVSPALAEVQKQADRIVLTHHGPAGVVINKMCEVLQFRGRTGLFLEHQHGEANLNLFKMAREGLLFELRSTVNKAIKQNLRVRNDQIRIKQNGHYLDCSIQAIPFSVPPSREQFYLILFEAKMAGGEVEGRKVHPAARIQSRVKETKQIEHLQDELSSLRQSMQAVIEEHEGTNEELRSANEEILSSNEELQSTNEELETAKEELQSTNEELTTLNDELESRNAELQQVNNDLHNLLASVSIPVIILSSDLRIRRFTTAAEKMFKLIPGDIGRPITDINVPLNIPNLQKEVLEVLETLAPKDLELTDTQNHWWSVRIRAYRTMEHKIDGVVIALMDIDVFKSNAERERECHSAIEEVIGATRTPSLLLNEKLEVTFANSAFYRAFKTSRNEIFERPVYALSLRHWDDSKLRTLLEEVLKSGTVVNNFDLAGNGSVAERKKFLLSARRVMFDGNEIILMSMEEP